MSADPPEDSAWVLMDIRDALVRIADSHDAVVALWQASGERDDRRLAQLAELESKERATEVNQQLADLIVAAFKRAKVEP